MNALTRRTKVLIILSLLLASSLMLSACSTPATIAPQPTTARAPTEMAPAPTIAMPPTEMAPAPTAAMPPTEMASTAPAGGSPFQYSLDSSGLATSIQEETVPAVTADSNAPAWEVLPEYTRLNLQGYPVSNSLMKPQIFIYPVEELKAANAGAASIVSSLQTLIKSPQEIANMPFLPLFNAQQVFHSNIQYLDFKNGQGLRYLTEFDQANIPINNYELFYTYQGLTSDGKYYVAAVLPVTHPSLPVDQKVTGNEPPEFTSDFPKYVASVAQALNTQAPDTFTPDLTKLDAMLSSLEIK
jgi:hypothetical protein